MIYGLITSSGLASLFLFLFIRTLITNARLKIEIEGLKRDVQFRQKQLEIAASVPVTPDDIMRRMRQGKL